MVTIDTALESPARFSNFGNPDFSKVVRAAIAHYNRYYADGESQKELSYEKDFYRKGKTKKRVTLEKLVESGNIVVVEHEPTVKEIESLKPHQALLMWKPYGIFDPQLRELLGKDSNQLRKKAPALQVGSSVTTQREADRPKNEPRSLIAAAYAQADPHLDRVGYEFRGMVKGTESVKRIYLSDVVDGTYLFAVSALMAPGMITVKPYADMREIESSGGRFIADVQSFSGETYNITMQYVPIFRRGRESDYTRSLWRSLVTGGMKRCGKSVYDGFQYPEKGLKHPSNLSEKELEELAQLHSFGQREGPQARKAPYEIVCDHVIAALLKLRQLTIEQAFPLDRNATQQERELKASAVGFNFYYHDMPFVALSRNVIGQGGFDWNLRKVGYVMEDEHGFSVNTRNITQREILLSRAFAENGPSWFMAPQGFRYNLSSHTFEYLDGVVKAR